MIDITVNIVVKIRGFVSSRLTLWLALINICRQNVSQSDGILGSKTPIENNFFCIIGKIIEFRPLALHTFTSHMNVLFDLIHCDYR